MSWRTNPPFRANVFGSLFRPLALLQAPEKRKKSEIT